MNAPSLILDKFRVEQRRLLGACEGLERMVAGPRPDSAEAMTEPRWNFTREMLLHFASIEEIALRPLMADRRSCAAAKAARSSHDMRSVYDHFDRHTRHWHGLPDAADWAEYRQAIHLLVRRVRVRLASEELDIHPLLPAQPGGRRVAAAVEPLNYSAEAWRIRGLLFPVAARTGAAG